MVQNGKYKIGVEKRITSLEVGFQDFKKTVGDRFDTLENNHLAHLAADIKEIKESQTWFLRLIVGSIIGFLFSVALLYFK